MAEVAHFDLVQDRKGIVWDLLLYIPTVVALASIAANFWYGGNHNLAYLLYFLACFFALAGFNRIFKTRLMMLPSAPISFEVSKQNLRFIQRNGAQIALVKNTRYYADYSGKSFGLSGLDGAGRQQQYVFLRGQFKSVSEFEHAKTTLKRCLD